MRGINHSSNALKSRAALAVLLFLAINLMVRIGCTAVHFDRFEIASRNWHWWPIKGYRDLRQAPDVVLFGSSLALCITNEAEATIFGRPVNVLEHHNSSRLEENILRRTGVPVTTYSLAMGGQHASDASVLATGLLDKKTPSTIIYMIYPRDFLDNSLPSPSATDEYMMISRMGGTTNDTDLIAREGFSDRASFVLNCLVSHCIALFDYQYELHCITNRFVHSTAIPVLNGVLSSVPTTPVAGLAEAPFDLSGQILKQPDHKLRPRLAAKGDLAYQIYYQPFRPKPYNTQLFFLKRMLAFARRKGIEVILVNMPLRQDHLTTMVPHFYDLYISDIQKIAMDGGAKLIDMFDSTTFGFDDFADTVHLNGFAAIKFVDKLSERIALMVALSAQRRQQAQQVAQQHLSDTH